MNHRNDINPWHVGDRVAVCDSRREVTVADVCGERVCCRWKQDGIVRRSWMPASRLGALALPRRDPADTQ